MEILVSGSLAYDRIMDFPGKFSDHILPDKIHILNVCFAIEGLRENFGGTAGNIVYGLSLLGERPRLLASAGRDFAPYRTWLEGCGIPTANVREVEDELTAGAYITTDQSDNQITAFNSGAMRHPVAFETGSLNPSSTLAIIAPGNYRDMERLSREFKELGIFHIFDPGQSLPAWTGEQLLEMISGSTIYITNDYELELTLEKTGLGVPELCRITGTLVTTRGEMGSLVRWADGGTLREVEIPAVPPREVKDPTGAGDAYRAGLLKGLVYDRRDVVHAARMGSAAASFAVEVYGTQTYRYGLEEFRARFRGTFRQDIY
jgi:adenosine kinase